MKNHRARLSQGSADGTLKIGVQDMLFKNRSSKQSGQLIETLEQRTLLSVSPAYYFVPESLQPAQYESVSHKTAKKVVTPIAASVTNVTPMVSSSLFIGSFKGYKQYASVTVTNSSSFAGKISETYTLIATTSPVDPTGGVVIGSGKVSLKLNAGASGVAKIQVNPPSTLTPGGYYIFAVPSGKGAIPNSGGRSASTVSIISPFVTLEDNRIDPPLDITQFQPQGTIHFTKNSKFVLPLMNTGNAPATGKGDLQFILSKDGTLNGSEGFVVMSVQNANIKINPGGTQKITLKIKKFALPAGFTAGNYFACVKVIGHGTLGTLNTLNNVCANETPVSVIP